MTYDHTHIPDGRDIEYEVTVSENGDYKLCDTTGTVAFRRDFVKVLLKDFLFPALKNSRR
ncbi:hypothetical protein F183_A29560 [Bryobacterales bacterium F-183]|nr:hypothetical protein F183_A29560 [Bryobacterales bacterium F-183]